MLRAGLGWDEAVDSNARALGGELALVIHSEGHGTLYGKKNISRSESRGGNLYTGIHHKFREPRTIKDFDWSDYGPKSLYNE